MTPQTGLRWGVALAGLHGVACAQALPDQFDAIGVDPEAPGLQVLALAPPAVTRAFGIGAQDVRIRSLGHVRSAPVFVVRNQKLESPWVWTLMAQSDGYKRVSRGGDHKSGWSDLTLLSAWSGATASAATYRFSLGLIAPAHGEVGSKLAAALAGLSGTTAPLGDFGWVGGAVTVVAAERRPSPGVSAHLRRADLQWGRRLSASVKAGLTQSFMRQAGAPDLDETALQLDWQGPGAPALQVRARAQRIEGGPSRRALGVSVSYPF